MDTRDIIENIDIIITVFANIVIAGFVYALYKFGVFVPTNFLGIGLVFTIGNIVLRRAFFLAFSEYIVPLLEIKKELKAAA